RRGCGWRRADGRSDPRSGPSCWLGRFPRAGGTESARATPACCRMVAACCPPWVAIGQPVIAGETLARLVMVSYAALARLLANERRARMLAARAQALGGPSGHGFCLLAWPSPTRRVVN